MIAIVTPAVLIGQQTADARQALALFALVAGLLTFVEYNARFPSLVEFRDAPPFNRLRFGMLFLTLFCLATIERGRTSPTVLTDLVQAIGALIGLAMDFPFSPVRLAKLMLVSDGSAHEVAAVRTAAGMAYLISLFCLALFVILVRMGAWPRRGQPFNVWVNLPTFDPTSGRDIVERLTRDACVNIALGFLLPFLTPAVVFIAQLGFAPFEGARPLTLIWTVT